MDFHKRRTLTGDGELENCKGVVGVVKKIDKGLIGSSQRIKIKTDENEDASVLVPKKYARNLKSEHKYEFHIEDDPFRGGGSSRFTGVEMSRRTRVEPTEVSSSNLGKGSSSSNGRFTRG